MNEDQVCKQDSIRFRGVSFPRVRQAVDNPESSRMEAGYLNQLGMLFLFPVLLVLGRKTASQPRRVQRMMSLPVGTDGRSTLHLAILCAMIFLSSEHCITTAFQGDSMPVLASFLFHEKVSKILRCP